MVKLAQQWPWLIAVLGFVSAVASYFLISGNEPLAQVIAIVMLVRWLLLVMDNALPAGLLKRFGLHYAEGASRKSVFVYPFLSL